MGETPKLKAAEARAELVAAGTPMHAIAALYPLPKRVEAYLRESYELEPWIDVAPTDDAAYWKMTQVCDATCHHPVHAFNHPKRLRHLVDMPTFD